MPKHMKSGIFIDIAKLTAICAAFALFQYIMEDPNYVRNFVVILVVSYIVYAITLVVVRRRRQ